MTERRPRLAIIGAAAYGAVAAVLLAAGFAMAQSDVVARGRFVDAVDHDVYRVRLLDRYTVYTENPPVPFDSDLATSFVLMMVSGIALLGFAMAVKWRAGLQERLPLFFLFTAMGATFMAFDEQGEFIDSLGYNIEALYFPDVFFYAPPALLFAWVFRGVLLRSRRAFAVLALGGLVFLAAEGMDRLPDDRLESAEEKLELVAVSLWAVAGVLYALDLLDDRGGADALEDVG